MSEREIALSFKLIAADFQCQNPLGCGSALGPMLANDAAISSKRRVARLYSTS
jgi:hypothetical protein